MHSRLILILICCFLLLSCGGDKVDWSKPTYTVSMVQLIVDPSQYEGENIRVFGYFGIVPSTKLFLTERHALAFDLASAIDIGDDTDGGEIFHSECTSKYVEVVGHVSKDPKIQIYMIYPVKQISIKEGGEVCWSSDG